VEPSSLRRLSTLVLFERFAVNEFFCRRQPGIVESEPKGPLDRALNWLTKEVISALTGKLGSVEQRKVNMHMHIPKSWPRVLIPRNSQRNEEYEKKLRDAIRQAIGERVKDMVKILVLATESGSQGRDYGGTLLDSVTSLVSRIIEIILKLSDEPMYQADLMGQTTMVQADDHHKINFYKAHGFKSVADVVLGNQNPRWHDVPVTIKIVSSPKSYCLLLTKSYVQR